MPITHKKLTAMLYLLQDTDTTVNKAVRQAFLEMGQPIIPALEKIWENSTNTAEQSAALELIQFLTQQYLLTDFKNLLSTPNPDLLKLSLLVSRIKYPHAQDGQVYNFLDEIGTYAWVNLFGAVHPSDQIAILNHTFYSKFGFTGDKDTYNHTDNSLIHSVIKRRKGNPISMAILYMIVAHNLGIPVFGVNLPHHFVLAYCQPPQYSSSLLFKPNNQLHRHHFGNVLFYINPFNKGQVFSELQLQQFLQNINLTPEPTFTQPCSNIQILQRILRNLHFSYGELNNTEMQQFIEQIQNLTSDNES